MIEGRGFSVADAAPTGWMEKTGRRGTRPRFRFSLWGGSMGIARLLPRLRGGAR